MDEIFVTNNNEFHHEDRFAGVDYKFRIGEKVIVPLAAAEHMLGFGLADKTETLVRLGWANRKNAEGDDEGVEWLRNFVFTEAEIVERVIEAA